jgi:hypothetical protein
MPPACPVVLHAGLWEPAQQREAPRHKPRGISRLGMGDVETSVTPPPGKPVASFADYQVPATNWRRRPLAQLLLRPGRGRARPALEPDRPGPAPGPSPVARRLVTAVAPGLQAGGGASAQVRTARRGADRISGRPAPPADRLAAELHLGPLFSPRYRQFTTSTAARSVMVS